MHDDVHVSESAVAVVSHLVSDYNWRAYAVLAVLTIGPLVVQFVLGDLPGVVISAAISAIAIFVGAKVLHIHIETR